MDPCAFGGEGGGLCCHSGRVVVVGGWGSVEAHDIRDRLCSQLQDGGGIVGAGGWGVGGQEGQPGTFFRSLVEWRVAEVLTVQPPETWPST